MLRLSVMDMSLIQEKVYGTFKRNRRIRALYNGARPTMEELGLLAGKCKPHGGELDVIVTPLSRQRIYQIIHQGGSKCGSCTDVPVVAVTSIKNHQH